jgi:hypothetical protein
MLTDARNADAGIQAFTYEHQITSLAPETVMKDVQGSSLSTTCSLDLKGFFIPFHLQVEMLDVGMPMPEGIGLDTGAKTFEMLKYFY